MGLENNVFLVSDASYSYQTKITGLGVIDLKTGREYSMSKTNIKGSHEAEYMALMYSVHIALKNKYLNVVFVYDNQTLSLKKLKTYLSKKMHYVQFLWLKREYIDKADRLASKARIVKEKLLLSSSKKIKFKNKNQELNGKELLHAFKACSTHNILIATCAIAGTKEKELVRRFLNQGNANDDLFTKPLDYKFINLVYYLLPRTKQIEFYDYLTINFSFKLEKFKIIHYRAEREYIVMVNLIIKKVKENLNR